MPVIGAAGFRSNRLPIWRLVALAVLVVVLGVRPGAAGELALDLDGDNEAVVAECAEAGDVELPAVLDDLDTESAEPELLAVLAALDDADDTNEAAELCARLLAALGLGDDQQADDDPSS